MEPDPIRERGDPPDRPLGVAQGVAPARHRIQEEVERRLLQAGHRASRNRRLLVWALADARRPMSVTELLQDLSEIPQSSVYRGLRVLEAVGVVVPVLSGDATRWELAEALTRRHHHYLICRVCGLVGTYEPSPELETYVVACLATVASVHDFDADSHRMDLVGRCLSCKKRNGSYSQT